MDMPVAAKNGDDKNGEEQLLHPDTFLPTIARTAKGWQPTMVLLLPGARVYVRCPSDSVVRDGFLERRARRVP